MEQAASNENISVIDPRYEDFEPAPEKDPDPAGTNHAGDENATNDKSPADEDAPLEPASKGLSETPESITNAPPEKTAEEGEDDVGPNSS